MSDLGCAVGGAGGIGSREEGVVLGVGGASTTLAGITVRTPVASALDLGTGSGIQALHAAQHATRVTATDLNPRALEFTRLTLALSGAAPADLREGSLFEPVGSDTFDLIVSNPPFVISPGARLTYRDGGMGGDDLCRTLVQESGDHLNEGVTPSSSPTGSTWRARSGRTGCAPGCRKAVTPGSSSARSRTSRSTPSCGCGTAATTEATPPSTPSGTRRGSTSSRRGRHGRRFRLDHPAEIRRGSGREPSIVVEEWPHAVQQPLGQAVQEHFARQDYLRDQDDAALLAGHFVLAAEVVQEQVGMPGAEDPEHVVLRQHRGMMRATKVDAVAAGFAGVCDGSLPAGRILDAIAQLMAEDPVLLRDRTPQAIRLLVEEGFLEPAPGVVPRGQ